ncbi:MAG: hypothetical protein ACPLUI_10450 [Desulfofundulus sp.]
MTTKVLSKRAGVVIFISLAKIDVGRCWLGNEDVVEQRRAGDLTK